MDGGLGLECEGMLNEGIHNMMLHVLCSGTLSTELGMSVTDQRRFLMRLGDRLFGCVGASMQEVRSRSATEFYSASETSQ